MKLKILGIWSSLLYNMFAVGVLLPGTGGSSCLCTFGNVSVPVDAEIAVDPNEGLIATKLRRLNKEFSIFGQFCQPPRESFEDPDRVQLLLHGSTYTHQYWTFPMNGFQNYSYAAFACSQGQATFAYDQLGVGLSDRPTDSSEIQLPVVAQIASSLAKKLKDGTISTIFGFGNKQRFNKVIGIAHSQGSVIYNFLAINQPTTSGFDGLILTGHIHDIGFLATTNETKPLARDVDPVRWGNLDPGYISSPNRSGFYAPDLSTFSQSVFMLDTLTLDVSVIWATREIPSVYVPAKGFKGPVVEMVGSMDQLHCLNLEDNEVPCNDDEVGLKKMEQGLWPDSRNFTLIVRNGSGHDLNLDFGAGETFRIYSTLARTMV
ncbi:hypothetical protein C8Q75DRAFT_792593 [Abortiporus biennis]|nr:hypothetical protein C8Q75DRAFT_792593 [Abortiporus biennis]